MTKALPHHGGGVYAGTPYAVATVAEKGWPEKGNGELLDLAEREG